MNSIDIIKEELNQIAPYLASLPRSNPFTVPQAYFEGIEMNLITVMKQDKDHETIHFETNEHPFNVPDGYFEKLPPAILLKIKNERDQERKTKASFTTIKISDYKLWLAAASVTAIIIVSMTLFENHHPTGIATSSTVTENSISDLMYASEVDDAIVVELYLQNQDNASIKNVSDDSNFLRDVVDVDPYIINEL